MRKISVVNALFIINFLSMLPTHCTVSPRSLAYNWVEEEAPTLHTLLVLVLFLGLISLISDTINTSLVTPLHHQDTEYILEHFLCNFLISFVCYRNLLTPETDLLVNKSEDNFYLRRPTLFTGELIRKDWWKPRISWWRCEEMFQWC